MGVLLERISSAAKMLALQKMLRRRLGSKWIVAINSADDGCAYVTAWERTRSGLTDTRRCIILINDGWSRVIDLNGVVMDHPFTPSGKGWVDDLADYMRGLPTGTP